MADKPTCSCGCSCGEAQQTEKTVNRIIFPCAGVANTEQITNSAAIQLTEEGYGGQHVLLFSPPVQRELLQLQRMQTK